MCIRDRDKGDTVCGWCDGKVGEEHVKGCVCRLRTVVLAVRILYVATVPEDWEKEMVEFQYNDSSRCSDNTIIDMHELMRQEDERRPCSCDGTTTKFVREATEDDEWRRFPSMEEVL